MYFFLFQHAASNAHTEAVGGLTTDKVFALRPAGVTQPGLQLMEFAVRVCTQQNAIYISGLEQTHTGQGFLKDEARALKMHPRRITDTFTAYLYGKVSTDLDPGLVMPFSAGSKLD